MKELKKATIKAMDELSIKQIYAYLFVRTKLADNDSSQFVRTIYKEDDESPVTKNQKERDNAKTIRTKKGKKS